MPKSELIQAFTAAPVFAGAGAESLEVLIADATLLRLSPKQHLFHMGEEAAYFFWVKSGSITLYRPSYSGDEKIFRIVGDGDLLAETAMFASPCHYPLSAHANTESLVYRLARERLLFLAKHSNEFSFALLESMATRISQAINRIDLLTISNSAQRLVAYLMDVYLQQGSAWLVLPASQNVLARQLNIAPETLSRQLGGFKRTGLIGGRNRELVLLDINGLCQAVDLPAPDMTVDHPRPSAHLGSSLFDCCNYVRQSIGRLSS
ncbi:Crp/Fnr family transcriptional regulator [Pollutimonas bauzanensis]|nr:Crp/Fnr family transcriptional regulator [Pollutimonas bauzanensis]